MIGMPGEDRHRPIDLLGRHASGELVRPGHGAEGEHGISFRKEIRIEPVRPADDKGQERHALIAAAGEIGGEFGARDVPAGFVTGDDSRRGAKQAADCLGFFALAVLRTACPALLDLALFDGGETQAAPGRRGAVEIALRQVALRAGLCPSDRDEKKTHSADVALARPISAPHLFEIVELPHFGTEQMDDDIAGVHQHPIAMRQSLNPRRLNP